MNEWTDVYGRFSKTSVGRKSLEMNGGTTGLESLAVID
jgi:hypothetical protein